MNESNMKIRKRIADILYVDENNEKAMREAFDSLMSGNWPADTPFGKKLTALRSAGKLNDREVAMLSAMPAIDLDAYVAARKPSRQARGLAR